MQLKKKFYICVRMKIVMTRIKWNYYVKFLLDIQN